MVFSAPSFLFIFLPVFFLFYVFFYKQNVKSANFILLLFSLLFLLIGSSTSVLLVLFSTLSSYIFGNLFYKKDRSEYFWIGLSIPILGLLLFKYGNFISGELWKTGLLSGFDAAPLNLVLPIGISFYTFQNLSYLIELKLRRIKPERSFLNLLLYITMFPQLIAGPIVRYNSVYASIKDRAITLEDFVAGGCRFIYGLAKKIIIADACGKLADLCYAVPSEELNSGIAFLGASTYFLQIYFDFSAYSDMAIGLGRMIGFRFPENFKRPYSATSLTDFWRRWHISLSNWFRDYLYIPL